MHLMCRTKILSLSKFPSGLIGSGTGPHANHTTKLPRLLQHFVRENTSTFHHYADLTTNSTRTLPPPCPFPPHGVKRCLAIDGYDTLPILPLPFGLCGRKAILVQCPLLQKQNRATHLSFPLVVMQSGVCTLPSSPSSFSAQQEDDNDSDHGLWPCR
ncbi:hypothetical protein K443DRAFT_463437 [Laccaria amethystina LaAM-08-1]|uniref:Uncharacterized protein n=1 Tax=Laccaria amethystina LaAM-08-1 TaxID=1095629 RepID=A0A0C9X2Z8_9AGAR|nr:hypothetical protein K443DRAFT_463437 [Laccaria amethystina LaAM-08-1]